MIELDPKNRPPYVGGTAVDVAAANRDGQPMRGPMGPAASSEFVAAGEQDATDLLSAGLVSLIRDELKRHPHFRGRASMFTIELVGETVVMTGRLPSYHLKQLLQEAIMVMPGVLNIDNQVNVVWPNY
jgi:hypothetical protein